MENYGKTTEAENTLGNSEWIGVSESDQGVFAFLVFSLHIVMKLLVMRVQIFFPLK